MLMIFCKCFNSIVLRISLPNTKPQTFCSSHAACAEIINSVLSIKSVLVLSSCSVPLLVACQHAHNKRAFQVCLVCLLLLHSCNNNNLDTRLYLYYIFANVANLRVTYYTHFAIRINICGSDWKSQIN